MFWPKTRVKVAIGGWGDPSMKFSAPIWQLTNRLPLAVCCCNICCCCICSLQLTACILQLVAVVRCFVVTWESPEMTPDAANSFWARSKVENHVFLGAQFCLLYCQFQLLLLLLLVLLPLTACRNGNKTTTESFFQLRNQHRPALSYPAKV